MKNTAGPRVTTKNTTPPSTAPSRVEVREQKYEAAAELTDEQRSDIAGVHEGAEPLSLKELGEMVGARSVDVLGALATVRRCVDNGTGAAVSGEPENTWAIKNRLMAHELLTCAEQQLDDLTSAVHASLAAVPLAKEVERGGQEPRHYGLLEGVSLEAVSFAIADVLDVSASLDFAHVSAETMGEAAPGIASFLATMAGRLQDILDPLTRARDEAEARVRKAVA